MGTSSDNMRCSDRQARIQPVFQTLQMPAEDNLTAVAGLSPEYYWDERPHWAWPQTIWSDHAGAPS